MARGFVRKNTLTKDTLLKIAKAGLITIAVLSGPQYASRLAIDFFKEKSKEAAQKRARKLQELKKRKLISIEDLADGSIRLKIAHKGEELIRQYNLEDMKLQIPKTWDHQWRIIMYDIPTKRQRASQALSLKLHQLGLYQFQRSVWISPYECLQELEFICAIFELPLDQYIFYFPAPSIPREKEAKDFFGL